MPKINVYLPDELAAAVRDAQIPVSAVCQKALEGAVRNVSSLREPGRIADGSEQPVPFALPEMASGRYTKRARRSVEFAQDAAIALDHNHVGTEHLLLGILEEGSNLAIKVLEALAVSPDDLRARLLDHIRRGEKAGLQPQVTPNARAALELALAEAAKLGHNYVGCEHLLLGLIREPEGLAGSVLRQLGLELRITRRAITTALSGFLHGPASEPVVAGSRLDEILHRLDAIERKLAG